MFWSQPEIYRQIDQYVEWKRQRHPYVAGSHKAILLRFVANSKVTTASEITEDEIAFFVGFELGPALSEMAVLALNGFLSYLRREGYQHAMQKRLTVMYLRSRIKV